VILLASASRVRARLLAEAGVAFEVRRAGIDEAEVKARLVADGVTPKVLAERLAEAKAMSVPAGREDLVIGADQTLELDAQLFDKAETVAESRRRLERFRGRTHALHTAAVIVRNQQAVWQATSTSRLTMRAFSDAFLDAYLQSHGDAALSSVGCYLLEGAGVQLFERIDGDYFAILGLPLIELLEALRAEGALTT
jgi:septum formation protein